MDKKAFWALIDSVNAEAEGGGQDRILELTEQKLMELPASEIRDWHSIQHEYAALADRNDLWAAYMAVKPHFSSDGFNGFRSWLISQGQNVFISALHDPDSLAEYDLAIHDLEFESYGCIAGYTYAQKALLEQEGPEALKQKYDEWWSQNSSQMIAQFENEPMPEEDRQRYLARWFKCYLAVQYDVYSAAAQDPLDPGRWADIQLDRNRKPDIDPNWTFDDLPEIVPKLYAKYDPPGMMTIYTVHV